jgi:hypothetical protein
VGFSGASPTQLNNRGKIMLKQKSIPVYAFLIVLLLAVTAPLAAQDEAPACSPPASRLAQMMNVACEELMAWHEQGFGYGQIMAAWRLSQGSAGQTVSWQDLLAAHQEGQGWGQVMVAHRLAAALDDPNLTADDLLALKQSGLGWGQIRQAHAVSTADLGLSFNDVITMMQNGMGWGEIRQQMGLPAGPPPWAGGPKRSGAEEGKGPGLGQGNRPPWAGGPPAGKGKNK